MILVMSMLMIPGLTHAENTAYLDSLWNKGVQAYTDGRWSECTESLEALESVGVVSPELYYNLGNAYFKSGTFWRAVQFWKQLSTVVALILWAKSRSGIVVRAVHPLKVLLNESAPVSPSKNPAGIALRSEHPSKADSRLILLVFVPKMLPTDERFVQPLNAIL